MLFSFFPSEQSNLMLMPRRALDSARLINVRSPERELI